jgi:hypothetical protein
LAADFLVSDIYQKVKYFNVCSEKTIFLSKNLAELFMRTGFVTWHSLSSLQDHGYTENPMEREDVEESVKVESVKGTCHLEGWEPVLRIHDILVWIRIRIRGSMPLTNESGCGSGSSYFRI